MNESPPRLGAKLAILAALWVLVFWLTPAPQDAAPRVADASTRTRPDDTPPVITEPDPAPPIVDPLPAATILPVADRAPRLPDPPPFTLYTVQAGDTIEAIATRLLNDPANWRAIAQMNPSVDPIQLRAGQQLRIPSDLSNIQGVTADAPPPSAPNDLIYVVARNDTLSDISLKVYGRATHWKRIQQANADIVNEQGTNLRPGMELRIPTLPADASH